MPPDVRVGTTGSSGLLKFGLRAALCYVNLTRWSHRPRARSGEMTMRLFAFCCFVAVWMSSNAHAGEADEAAFRYAIATHLRVHPMPYPADLKERPAEGRATVTFSIDREGKLLDAQVASGTGSAKADQDILDWLSRLQPFPRVPVDFSTPVKFSEEIVFVPRSLNSDMGIKWIVDAGASAKEVAFRDQVASHLQRHPRTYSEDMQAGNGTRREVVSLVIGDAGKLLKVEIIKKSGAQKVDEETMDWLAAAQPYPEVPTDLRVPLKLTAEIAFGPPREGIWSDKKIKRAINNVCRGC
jgi:TonB family protein